MINRPEHIDGAQQPRRSPWSLSESRHVYENAWINVREDQVIRPDGRPGIYGVVSFKNIATGVVALDNENRVALVGQWRYPLDRWSWEIPEGGAPANEDPLDAARRELREEAGITARDWRPLIRSHLSNCVTNEESIVYLARDLTLGDAAPDPEERLELRWAPLAKTAEMIESGEITDAVSQLGLFAALRLFSM